VIDDSLEKVNKNIVEFADEPDQLKHWESERERLTREKNHLNDLQAELAEPDAIPFKNLKAKLAPPKPKRKPKPTTRQATKDLPGKVGSIILQKKARAYLISNGYEPTEERIKTVIEQGLVK
jgi:hypothetical protein